MKRKLLTTLVVLMLVVCVLPLAVAAEGEEEHTCDYGSPVTTKDPTCTEPGVQTRTCTDSNCTSIFRIMTQSIPANGHNNGDPVTNNPTCTEPGTIVTTCSVCGYTKTSAGDAALGHSWWQVKYEAPTCDKTGVDSKECDREGCNAKSVKPVAALGHNWQQVKYEAPTCDKTGVDSKECDREGCNAKSVKPVAALGHQWEVVEETPATCETAGYSNKKCIRVNCTAKSIKSLDPLGHNYAVESTTPVTCTTDGATTYVCRNDSTHTYTDEIPAIGHDYVGTVTKTATCTTDGVMTYVCKHDAEHTYTAEIKAPAAHKWDTGKITTAATCYTDGVKTYTCTRTGCKGTKTEAIPATGLHSYTYLKADAESHWVLCATPGCTFQMGEYHHFSYRKILRKATLEENGMTVKVCNCGYRVYKQYQYMTNPKTGDYIMIAVGVMAVSAVALVGMFIYKKKKKF